MTSVAATAHGAQAHHDDRSFVRKYIFSTDHKIIGIQFLFVSLFFLLIGGLLATGLLGIFIGPTVLAVGYTLLNAWMDESGETGSVPPLQ